MGAVINDRLRARGAVINDGLSAMGNINDSTAKTMNLRNRNTIFLIRRRKCADGVRYYRYMMVGLACFVLSITTLNLQWLHMLKERTNMRMATVQQKSYSQIATRPFPKWGSSIAEEQEIGISFPPILSFIQTSSPYKEVKLVKHYYRSTLDHGIDSKTQTPALPETLYMIQPSTHENTAATLPPRPMLHSSNLHRLRHGVAVAKSNVTLGRKHKVNQTERFMLHALQVLHQDVLSAIANQQQQDDDVCQYSQWTFLCRNLYPSLTSNSTTSASSQHNDTTLMGGFPFLTWYGDFTGCNHHNWRQVAQGDLSKPITWKDLYERGTENVSIPLFTVAAHTDDCNYAFPFPNFFQTSDILQHSNGSQADWDNAMEHDRPEYAWSQKLSKIVWRGTLTGRIDDNVTKCPRWNMVETIHHIESQRRALRDELEMGRQNVSKAMTTKMRSAKVVASSVSLPPSLDDPEIFDAKITAIPHTETKYQSQLEHELGGQPSGDSQLPFHDFQKYRAIIDIDGHSWSGRFGSLLCMNSVVLKVDPSYVEYFYARQRSGKDNELQAWIHYIPVRADFSNLEEMAEYVLDPANDDALQEMVHQANDWCRQNMIVSRILTDMLDVWDRYVELLNINNEHWLEQYWTDTVQSTILENRNLNMVLLNISDYPPL